MKSKQVVTIISLVIFSILSSFIFYFSRDKNLGFIANRQENDSIYERSWLISGKIKATENDLAVIKITFEQKNDIDELSEFRLKKNDSDQWYHVATIEASNYFNTPIYSFGFAPIHNSKGNSYNYEIELLKQSSSESRLRLSENQPIILMYKYGKEKIAANLSNFVRFSTNKLLFFISEKSAWMIFMTFSVPLLTYFGYLIMNKKFPNILLGNSLKNTFKKIFTPSVILLLLITYIKFYLSDSFSDLSIIIFIGYWIVNVIGYKFSSRHSFLLSLLLLIQLPFYIWTGFNNLARNQINIIYALLCVATIQSILPKNKEIHNFFIIKLTINIATSFTRFIDKIYHLGVTGFFNICSKVATLVSYSKPKDFKDALRLLLRLFMILVGIIISLLLIISLGRITYRVYRNINHEIMRKSLDPVIELAEPHFVYKSSKYVIYGKNFGWDKYHGTKLIVDEKFTIDPEMVTLSDSQIVFTIPLDWEYGPHSIHIEKIIDWDGKQITAKSKQQVFKILPITQNETVDDRQYFKQLNGLRKQTLELNGYNE